MFEGFKAKAEGAGCQVLRFSTKVQAFDFLLHFIRSEGVTDSPGAYAIWPESPILRGIDTKSFEAIVPGLIFTATRQLAKDARIGITQMDWGIADTGTLVQDSTAVEQRLASSLPRVHIALLGTDHIVPDLPALLEKVRPERSGYIALITGPSRTWASGSSSLPTRHRPTW